MGDNYRTYHLGEITDQKRRLSELLPTLQAAEGAWRRQYAVAKEADAVSKREWQFESVLKEEFRTHANKFSMLRSRFGENENELFDLPEHFDDWNERH